MVTYEMSARLPLLPAEARVLSPNLAIARRDGKLVLFNAAGPIFECREDDKVGTRLAAAIATDLRLAPVTVVASALGVDRTTVHRDHAKLVAGGVGALQPRKCGPKGPHKLKDAALQEARNVLAAGGSQREAAARAGVSEFAIRYAIKTGLLQRHTAAKPSPTGPVVAADGSLVRPAQRATQDRSCDAGVAVKRTEERALARVGVLGEAAPVFTPAEAVPAAGVLLAVPALLEEGLIEVGQSVYGRLRNGFFGLRSVLLIFAFMALLRIKTPEQITGHAPGELGLLLGLDRAPEVKTLRRKLRELGERRLAHTFLRRFAERWARAHPRELALLYVDGHVRPYHGRTHVLPKHHVQQRGRPMPGTKDFHVNDRRAEPLLFVTAQANESLLAMLDSVLLPEVRRLVGERRVTIAFDREGWSPRRFAQWKEQGFNVLTYRKGDSSRWRERAFATVAGRVGGESVNYRLAEREVKLSNGLRVREVRRLTEGGKQTAVITTCETMPMIEIAHRMFSRWRQENFFRYMRHEFALDHLSTHAVEPADPIREVPNPQRAQLQRQLTQSGNTWDRLVERAVQASTHSTVLVGRRRLTEKELEARIERQGDRIGRLEDRLAELPKRVPLDQVLDPAEIVQLERERKVLVDAIKLVAYRTETALARYVAPHYARHDEEVRRFLKSVFLATADLIPDERAKRLTVRFHGLASPRATRALRGLCEIVNATKAHYPGTPLQLHFEAP